MGREDRGRRDGRHGGGESRRDPPPRQPDHRPVRRGLGGRRRPVRQHSDPPYSDGENGTWRALSDLLGIRGKFFDEAARHAVDDGVRQVVLLASGLDTRSHRLHWPAGTVVFEIDQPAVLEFKVRVLQELAARATCEHRPAPADLRSGWTDPRHEAGFDPGRATLWIAEWLLYYLTPDSQRDLLESVHAYSASGSRWVIEDDPGFLERARSTPSWRSGCAVPTTSPPSCGRPDSACPPRARWSAAGWSWSWVTR